MAGPQSQYDIGLEKTPANFVALTPLSFLARTAAVYPDHTSAVYEGRSFTWSETYARCRRFASYLAGRNIGLGDTVAAMLPNVPFGDPDDMTNSTETVSAAYASTATGAVTRRSIAHQTTTTKVNGAAVSTTNAASNGTGIAPE